MTWPSALWETSLQLTTSAKPRNTEEKRYRLAFLSFFFFKVTHFALYENNTSAILSGLFPNMIAVLQEAMVRITSLLAEDLRKELYQLWEVGFCPLAEISVNQPLVV